MRFLKRRFAALQRPAPVCIGDAKPDEIQEFNRALLAESLDEVLSIIDMRTREIIRKRGKEGDALWALEEIYLLDRIASFVETLSPSSKSKDDHHLFVLDSYFLGRCARELNYDGAEDMVVCSGPRIGNARLVSYIHRPKLESSAIHVRQRPGEIAAILRELEPYGSNIHAIFHSHPGGGIPEPSSNDHECQSIIERLGYRSIAGIFTNDGYIRFFSEGMDFSLLIVGKGLEQVDEFVYRLESREARP